VDKSISFNFRSKIGDDEDEYETRDQDKMPRCKYFEILTKGAVITGLIVLIKQSKIVNYFKALKLH
jgi:hypothetical protein